ncbi:LPS assembly protein LptD [Thalassotalea marina]|uniref:LPS-assembly protein LptD n=1 Tax=Thalassotalea marina TaxID=1673741 RepID=A0A919BC05_9GAMM|nr:LPS assembly protein LptD [Thalassotalea marina]GHF78416.1 LPS-assembly protein LptD [Thalassotalea marina]
MSRFRTLLILFSAQQVSSFAYGQTADNTQPPILTCPVPSYERLKLIDNDTSPDAINIISQTGKIRQGQYAQFSGGVTLYKDGQVILADNVAVNRQTASVNASGNIHFQGKNVDIFAEQLKASRAANSTELAGSSYQLLGNPGHGGAANIKVTADGTLTLTDSSFTTCYGEVPDWQLNASEISLSVADNHGEAYNARFSLFGVPILYIPYFSFPVTNERKSGFLYPKIGSSGRSGFQVEVPYYWNIAPNMDATITPRYMSKRGTQLLTEFRYLSGLQSGSINLEYLNSDKELTDKSQERYLARIQHVGTFSDNFRAYVDYTTISDDNYLVDIKSDQYNSNDAYLYQIGELAYFGENWSTKVLLQDFEVLGQHKTSYKTLPHIEFNQFTYLPFWDGEFDIASEITQFTTQNRDLPEAERYHIEAGVTFPISTPAWFLNSEFRILQTNYVQTRLQNSPELEKHVNRTLPKVRFHGGINLDRNVEFLNTSFTQTLEPQIQYLYIPDEDQSNIGVYDTTSLQDDFGGLFRDRRFSGLDRIAQANQYSWGITSRLLDHENAERFRLSLGRIVYLNETNLSASRNESSTDKSAYAGEIAIRFNRDWQFSSDIQYDTELDKTSKSQSSLDYRFANNNTIQLNHRYSNNVSGTKLEQVSLLSTVAINKNWQFVGRVTQDLKNKRSLESYAGFQYESCCWAIRFAFHRHINSYIEDQNNYHENRDEFDSGFMIEFVIKGLGGSKQSRIDTTEMFNSSIFGYKRPYFLNN